MFIKQTLLLIMGLIALFVGFVEYFDARSFVVDGKVVALELASPSGDLKYMTEGGYKFMMNPHVPGGVAERVKKGERVEVVYIKSNPDRRILKGTELPKGGIYISVGLGLVAFFIISLWSKKK